MAPGAERHPGLARGNADRSWAWARAVLRTGWVLGRPFALDIAQAAGDGMACGGEIKVLVNRLDVGNPAVRDFFAQALGVLTRGERDGLARC
jgi:xanthine/CO dehydrogenase XdhC/CoxF family maturation factor